MKKQIYYLDPFSILVVNKDGKLIRVHCPFLARSSLATNSPLEIVEMVLVENDLEFSILIKGKKQPLKYWDIVLL